MQKIKKTELKYYEKPLNEPIILEEYMVLDTDFRKLYFHNLLEISYCVSGSGQLIFDRESIRYTEDSLFIIPANIPHFLTSIERISSNFKSIYLDVGDLYSKVFPSEELLRRNIVKKMNEKIYFLNAEKHSKIIEKVKEIIREMEEKRLYYRENICLILSSLFLEVHRIYDLKNIEYSKDNLGTIKDAINFIDENYMRAIKIKKLADICKLSEASFRKNFREKINLSPIEYINMVRINKAKELIIRTNMSMEEISRQVGYTHLSTFNRNFKKIEDSKPYRYRLNR